MRVITTVKGRGLNLEGSGGGMAFDNWTATIVLIVIGVALLLWAY